MRVELKLSDEADAHKLMNMLPLYLHDISEFEVIGPNQHGINTDDDEVQTLSALRDCWGTWWKDPERLFPYLILADGKPAGFNLIAKPPYFPKEIDAELVIYGFFMLHAFRGKGVAEQAATLGLDRHRGKWEICTYPASARASAFWRKTVRNYAPGAHTEEEIDHAWGRRLAFTFDNSGTD